MKTTRKSDSQIMQILSQAGSGVPVSELCRELWGDKFITTKGFIQRLGI
jgi:hypothetical protein